MPIASVKNVALLVLVLVSVTFTVILLATSPSKIARARINSGAPARAASRQIRLPSRSFNLTSKAWKDLDRLIILPGHAIQWCTELGRSDLLDESCWYLLDYQRGQVPIYVEHVKRAAELALEDPRSLLVFSGGPTRAGLGSRTEGKSYFALAENLELLPETVYDRAVTEDFARDSLENLIFSMCRFRQISGKMPNRVTVVGFPFKAKRFVELHRRAASLSTKAFEYVSVKVPGFDQDALIDAAYNDFSNDSFGCGERLLDKKRGRNPYNVRNGYLETCPELGHALTKCPACSEGIGKYTCPRCNLEYCSLACYKSPQHERCSQSMAEESLSESLKREQLDEDAKRQMMDILRRFSSLDVDEDGPQLDGESSDLGFLGELTAGEVRQMSAEELAARIGPEALLRFHRDLEKNPKFIEAELQQWRPWWIRNESESREKSHDDRGEGAAPLQPVPEALEEVPPLSELTPDRPPEALWNNLIELLYLYAYLSRVYSDETLDNAIGFCRDFLGLSQVLSSPRFTHCSALHAIRAIEAAVTMESELYLSEETKALIVKDVALIISKVGYILAALGDLQRLFEKTIRQDRANFLAAKKLYFYNVWLHDEARNDWDLVETIVVSLKALVKGYLTQINRADIGEDLKALKIPKSK